MSEQIQIKTDRIEIIDVLRGFSLMGIIIVHFIEQYYAGQPPESVGNFGVKTLADQIVQGISGVLIQGKFFTIFSFLFGLSFYIQLDKSRASSSFLLRFAWRLLVLFAIGLVHHLHYRGDILSIYAVLGFGLLLTYKLPDKSLLIIALLLVMNIPSFVIRCASSLMETSGDPFHTDQKELLLYFNTLKSGSYVDIMKANIHEFIPKFNFQVLSGRIYITFGLFLLGLYAGRKNFFGSWEANIPWIKRMCKISLWTILGCFVFTGLVFGVTALAKINLNQSLQWALGGLAYDVFNASLSVLYVMGILLLFRKEKWKHRLHNLYALGRMGLTTYLMQTLFGVFIYFSIGFSLLNEIGALTCLSIALVIFAFQIQFSKWWLKRFQYGPIEWLWRSITYFKMQPLLKAKELAEVG